MHKIFLKKKDLTLIKIIICLLKMVAVEIDCGIVGNNKYSQRFSQENFLHYPHN